MPTTVPPFLRPFAALALALLLALTGVGLASARGPVEGQGLVLCSGGGLVQVELDAEGNPTGKSRLCPTLAATALAALPVPEPALQVPVQLRTMPWVATVARAFAPPPPAAFAARAPPYLSS